MLSLKKNVDPLMVSGAMEWYNETIGLLKEQKTITDSIDEIPYRPSGNLAELFTDELWYAVEAPLDFGDRSLLIMTPEVSDYTNTHRDVAIKQTMKLVVLRNKETGDTYSFIMAVIPELDYMLRKEDKLNEITYLSRDLDLDGYIFFYTLNGELINGWMYKGRKVIGGTNNLNADGNRTKITRAVYVEIKVCGSYMVECGGESSGGTDCYSYIKVVYIDDGTGYSSSGGGVNTEYPNSGGGTNSDSSVPITPTPSGGDKEPDKRADCTEQAAANAKNAKDAMTGNSDIESKLNTMKEAARNKPNEFTAAIGTTNAGKYTMSTVFEGTEGESALEIYESTIYNVHTHSNDPFVYVYTGPSVEDIYHLLGANKFFTEAGHQKMRGIIIFAYDGSEYLLSINNRSQAFSFAQNNLSLFESNQQGLFANESMFKEYNSIYKNLLLKDFSMQDANDYSIVYLLDKYNTGLKISKKEDGEAEFKEMKTEFRNAKIGYQPKKCP